MRQNITSVIMLESSGHRHTSKSSASPSTSLFFSLCNDYSSACRADRTAMASITRPRVFLDISVGMEPIGRLVIELFVDKAPKTCEKYECHATTA